MPTGFPRASSGTIVRDSQDVILEPSEMSTASTASAPTGSILAMDRGWNGMTDALHAHQRYARPRRSCSASLPVVRGVGQSRQRTMPRLRWPWNCDGREGSHHPEAV